MCLVTCLFTCDVGLPGVLHGEDLLLLDPPGKRSPQGGT